MVVDSAISIDNVIGEVARVHVKRYTTTMDWHRAGWIRSSATYPLETTTGVVQYLPVTASLGHALTVAG